MIQERYNNYKVLTLLTSEECNLNCKYCHIAQGKNNKKENENENEKIKKSFLDGTYLKNILLTCEKLNVNKKTFEKIEIWGQEPTLTLNEFSVIIPELFVYFSNIQELFFSTNGIANIDKIISFIEVLNNNVDKLTIKNKFNFKLQFSYDGEYSTKEIRGANPQIIKNNIIYLIEKLNNINLDNMTIELNIHGVLSLELLEYFNKDKNKIIKYWDELIKFNNIISKINNNKNLTIKPYYLGLEAPVNASQNQGELLYNFALNSKILNKTYQSPVIDSVFYQHDFLFHVFKDVCNEFYNDINYLNYKNLDKLNELIHRVLLDTLTYYNFDNKNQRIMLESFSHFYCAAYTNALKIRYNGQIVHCQDTLHQLTTEIKNTDTVEQLNGLHMYNHNFYPNVIEDNIEPLYKGRYLTEIGNNSAFAQMFSITLNLMLLLRDSNQIDKSYQNDDEKLLRHAFYFTFACTCMNNEILCCGTSAGRKTGHIRLFCNGFMDLLEKNYLESE